MIFVCCCCCVYSYTIHYCYRWAERKVLDISCGGPDGKWIMSTTCLRVGTDGQPVTYNAVVPSCLVSIQHLQLGKAIVFPATGATINRDSAIACIEDVNQRHQYGIGCIKLDVVPSSNSAQPASPPPITDLSANPSMLAWLVRANGTPRSWSPVSAAPGSFVCISHGGVARVVTASASCISVDVSTGTLLDVRSVVDEPMASCVIHTDSGSRSSSNKDNLDVGAAAILLCVTTKGRIFNIGLS